MPYIESDCPRIEARRPDGHFCKLLEGKNIKKGAKNAHGSVRFAALPNGSNLGDITRHQDIG
jgi:hypothetical protein